MRQPVKRKRRKRARFLSALMAVVLLATTVPSSTFAQQTEESSTEETSTESSTTGSTSGDILNGSNEQNQSTSSSDENSGGNTSGSSSDGGEENISDSSSGGDENIPGSSSEGDENIPGSSSGGDENIPSPSAGEDEENIPGSSSDGSSSVGPSVPSSESSVEGTSVESSSVPEGGTSLPGDPENGQNGQDNEGLILKVEAYEGTAETVIYWVTEDGDAAERPAAGSYTQFKLYFSIDGGDDTELTNSTKGEVGLIDLPSVSTTDNGDGCGYRLHVEGLPSKLQYVSPETEAMEGVDQREDGEPLSVSWKIVPQDDLAEYTLHEVSDPAEVIYASKGAGWYYVKEAEQPSAPAEETEDEITVTGWRDSYSKTVFWADNQNEGEVRPSVGNYPLPKLYFTYTVTETEDSADMDSGENTSEDNENAGDEKTAGETDGSDSVEGSLTETVSGIELTEESMKQVGLTVMPEIRITDNGDSYTLTIGENILPASFERTRDGVKGTGSVEWEIVLQEVTGYDLVEVTEEDLNERPDEFFYAEATGTYYVIEGLEAEKEEETLEITGWAEESRSTVYWMDYNNGYGTRPDQVTPELYFTMSRKDGQEEEGCGKRLQLTEENLSKLGLESMPEFRMESKGTAQKDGEELQLVIKGAGGDPVPFTVDVYEVILDGESLPIALTRTVGEEKTEYIVEWEILPAEVEHYTRMEVTEDNLAQKQEEYPYVTGEGWYYVLDMGEEIAAYSEATVTVIETETVEQDIYWRDNNNESSNRPGSGKEEGDYLSSAYKPELHFKKIRLDESGNDTTDVIEGNLSETNKEQVYLEELPEMTIDDSSVSAWKLSAAGLPTTVEETDIYGNVTRYRIEWTLVPKSVNGYELVNVTDDTVDKYPSIKDTTGAGWYYMKTAPVTYDFVFHTGNPEKCDVDAAMAQIMNEFQLYYRAGSLDGKLPLSDEKIGFSYTVSGNTVTLSTQSVMKYNLDGSEIVFRVDLAEGAENAFDSLDGIIMDVEDSVKISFDNTQVPSHSGDTESAYSGGKIVLTLDGKTSYTAYKKWLDNGNKNLRPDGELQLWRFREGESFTTAARVDGTENTQNLKKDDYTITFGISETTDESGVTIVDSTLPKYDPEGYRYIYVVREYLESGGYTQVFGSVSEDGTVTDTLVGYGEGQSRASNDINLYNGGTLSNRISGTVETGATKLWNASAFQAEFTDVSVELKLQCRIKDSNDVWADAVGNNGEVITKKLGEDGFLAEELTGISFEQNASRYDALGRELEYRWIECGVYQGKGSTNNLFVPDADGEGGSFTLHQSGRDVLYRSDWVIQDGDPENGVPYTSTITNSVRDTIQYDVEKVWENGAGPHQVTLLLYRSTSEGITSGALVQITFDASGNLLEPIWTDSNQIIAGYDDIDAVQNDDGSEKWKASLTGLAEYDEEGRKYEYFLLEQSGFPTYETEKWGDDKENYRTKVINGPGSGNRIMVRKRWIDDGDDLHREAVTIGVYNKTTNDYIDKITLDNGIWYGFVGIGEVDPKDVYIVELQVGNEVLVKDPEKVQGPSADYSVSYQGTYHKYDVSYDEKNVDGTSTMAYIAINRRLGNVDLTVTKNWIAGDGEKREEIQNVLEKLPDDEKVTLNLKLVFTPEFAQEVADGTFEINYTTNQVRLINDNKSWTLIEGEREGSTGEAIQQINLDREVNQQKFYFYNLPKYDAAGSTARYTVEEVWIRTKDGKEMTIADMQADTAYADLLALWSEVHTEIEETDYQVSDNRGVADTQTIDVTNRLSGSKNITWYKNWHDGYNYDAGLRPDIYLDVYRLVHVDEISTKIEGVLNNYKWEYQQNSSNSNIKDRWEAQFTNLPKYDDLGYEIIYYAIERTQVNSTDFEYQDIGYLFESNPGESGQSGSNTVRELGTEWEIRDQNAVSEGLVYPLETVDGKDHYALREEGTFVNTVDAKITVAGRKIWSNLPDGFEDEHLPEITFTLWRTTNDPNDPNGTAEKVAEITMNAQDAIGVNNRFKIQYLGVNQYKKTTDADENPVVETDADGNPVVKFDPSATQENSEYEDLFPNGDYTETLIPKYSEAGDLYTYYVKETITAPEDGWENNLPYDISQVEGNSGNNFTLTNVYGSETGVITARKLLYLPVDTKVFPAVTLELRRRYETQNGVKTDWVKVDGAELTWKSTGDDSVEAAFKDAVKGSTGVWLEHDFTFTNLELYAPNGSPYEYQVREIKTSEGAYETWVTDGKIEMSAADGACTDANKATIEPGNNGKWYAYLVKNGKEYGITPTRNSSEPEASITFLNKAATQEGFTLKGTKRWMDLENIYGFRPTAEDFLKNLKLYRKTAQQPGGSAIDQEPVLEDEYEIQWDGPTNGDEWTYTVTGENGNILPQDAPNDMPWIYVVKETLEAGSPYMPSPNAEDENGKKTASAQQNKTENDVGTIGPLTNSILTSKPFQKEWTYTDGTQVTEDYLGFDLSVTFKLQVSDDNKVNWYDAEEYFSTNEIDVPQGFVFEKTLTGPIAGDVWSKEDSFTNLPIAVKVNETQKTLVWRVVESKIKYGNVEINVSVQPIADGEYTYTFEPNDELFTPGYHVGTSNNENTVIHRNVLNTADFKVTKTWVGDHNNAYQTRPATDAPGMDWEVCFVIQRSTDGTNWKTVKDSSNQAMVVYVTGTNEEDSKTVSVAGLPGADENGEPYQYRARELQPKEGSYADGNVAEKDILKDSNATFYDAYTVQYTGTSGTDAPVTIATNTLVSKDIYAQKIWQGSERVDVTLSLQYLKAADEKDEKNWVTIAEVTVDGKTDQSNLPYYETAGTEGKTATWNAIFGSVPKRMPGSYLPANTSETKYRVVETLVTSQPEDYKLISSGGSGTQNDPFTFTNTTVTSLSIIKNWYPTTTQKKGQVTVGIYRTTESDMANWKGEEKDQYIENEEWKKVTLSEGDGWKETLSDLIKYDSQGNRIFYYAREISVGCVPVSDTSFPFKVVYEDEKTNQENETQTTISNIELTDITATKTWIDNSDAYQTRPDSLSLTLYRTTETGNWQEIPENKWESVNVEPEVTQNGDVWTYLYKGVPLTDDDGLSYTYKVEENDLVEVSSKEYRLAIAEDAPDEAKGDWYVFSRGTTDPKLELVNTLDGQKKITLRKVWEDNNDPDLRKEIEIKLVGTILDGSQVVYDHTWKLNSSMLEKLIYGVIFKQPDTWIYELTVDKYDAQQRYITYTAEEVKVPEGYDVYYETDRVFGNADELMHITFTARNVREGNLTVTKTVSGGNGDIWKDWRFTVTLSDKTVNGTYGEMTFKDGVATFTLKHGQTKTATGLPGGITYTVSEEEANQNGYTTTASGAGGTIPIGGTATAAFTNHNDPEEERRDDDDDTPPTTVSANAVPPVSALPIIPWITGAINGAGVPTGDMAAPLLYIGLAVLALAVIVIVLITGKKRRKKRRTSGQAGRKRSRRKNRK